jgi:hypothetical protein
VLSVNAVLLGSTYAALSIREALSRAYLDAAPLIVAMVVLVRIAQSRGERAGTWTVWARSDRRAAGVVAGVLTACVWLVDGVVYGDGVARAVATAALGAAVGICATLRPHWFGLGAEGRRRRPSSRAVRALNAVVLWSLALFLGVGVVFEVEERTGRDLDWLASFLVVVWFVGLGAIATRLSRQRGSSRRHPGSS